jgi:hypothetical protein
VRWRSGWCEGQASAWSGGAFSAAQCSGAGRIHALQVPGAEYLVPVFGDENHVVMHDETHFQKNVFASVDVTATRP